MSQVRPFKHGIPLTVHVVARRSKGKEMESISYVVSLPKDFCLFHGIKERDELQITVMAHSKHPLNRPPGAEKI